jgi:hypothetical protein
MEQPKSEEVPTTVPEAAPAAPATPAAKPGPTKKTWLIVAVVAVVAVLVIAAVVLGTGMLNSDDGNDGDDGGNDILGETWEPQSGDYLEYTTDTFIGEMVTKQTYKEVTATMVTINTTTTVLGSTEYDEQTIPLDQSYGGADFNVSDPPDGYSVVNKGSQSISTEWGSKSCKHYQATTTQGGSTGTMDMWFYKGILMKMVVSAGGLEMTMTLTDTNVNEITG